MGIPEPRNQPQSNGGIQCHSLYRWVFQDEPAGFAEQQKPVIPTPGSGNVAGCNLGRPKLSLFPKSRFGPGSVASDAAKSLGIDSVTGSLQPNKEADVIIVDGNPAEDINTLWNIADIILPGMIWGKVLRCPYAHAKILSISRRQPLNRR